MLSRREFVSAAAAAVALPAVALRSSAQPPAAPAGPFTLGKLPYDYTALEPVIDAETMTIHHTKHHQAYVDNLNKAVAGTDYAKHSLDELVSHYRGLPEAIRTAVQNNGGGHWNHTFYWSVMAKPGTGGEPKGELLKAIDASFGTLDGLKKAVLDAATKRFGSGWAWVVPSKDKPLAVVSTPNQDSPLMTGVVPILGVDVWEHAYYLKYKNLRAKYVEEWFKVVNWDKVAEFYAGSKK
jgi:Fe-Mn family superoxide dismutase